MQKSLQFSAIGKGYGLVLFVAAWLAGLAPGWAADQFSSDWSDAGDAKVRLVAGNGPVDGAYRAAIEMRLAPGWLTYWRNPGDAGVPPTFSFAGSDNLAAATVAFPPPTRIAEAGGEAIGYRGSVDLALTVTPSDPAKPVRLAMALDYAICAQICVPAKAQATLQLAPTAASPDAAAVAAAFAALPRPLPAGGPKPYRLAAEPGKDPSWRLTWTDPAIAPDDLFVEAPDGWYLTSRPGGGSHDFVISAVERPKGATAVETTVTTRGASGSRVFALPLDLPK